MNLTAGRQASIIISMSVRYRSVLVACAIAVLAGRAGAPLRGASAANEAPSPAATQPASSLQYWLDTDAPATTTAPTVDSSGVDPFARDDGKAPATALPGAIQLSDGTIIRGWLYTPGDKPLQVFTEHDKRWRQIPLAAAMSISAVVVTEKVEPEWRWKAMGEPQRVYTGRMYPSRRLQWRFALADGSVITGAVKGQSMSVVSQGNKLGPFILHERQQGRAGTSLVEMPYVRKIVISRRAMSVPAGTASCSQPATAATLPNR